MIDKQIKEDICPYQGECSINGCKRNNDDCFIKQLFEERYKAEKQIIKLNKTIKTKEQENEELRQYHNKCCEENAKKLEEWLEKYNQVSRDFHNGKYCNEENCNLLKAKEQECERWKKANDEKNELLAKLGCPTIATARREAFTLQQQIDTLKAERDKIKAIGDNYFDEYEMCCLDLPDAIDSLLKRYDNAFIKFKKERKELKEDNDELKKLLKVRIEDLCDSCGASSMMPMPCKVYEKTLIEIKEIIKQGVKIHDDIIVSKQILQKISECEVENA